MPTPQPVAYLDVPRFMGQWFEIASIPYFTQRRCLADTTAEYRLRADDDIDIVYRCRCQGGEQTEARGLARIIDRYSQSKWAISLQTLFGTHLFWDDFWILDVGYEYDYALIGIPSRRRGWLLARTAMVEETSVRRWLQGFAGMGYDLAAFRRTVQGR